MACVATSLQPVKFDCEPNLYSGKIRKVRAGAEGRTAMADYTDATEWASILDDSTIDIQKVRTFELEADLPVPTWQEADIGHGVLRRTTGIQTMPFIIRDLSAENFAFIQSVKKGVEQRIWFEDKKNMYSTGNSGIKATMFIDFTIPTDGGFHNAVGRFEWDAEEVILRTLSPLAV